MRDRFKLFEYDPEQDAHVLVGSFEENPVETARKILLVIKDLAVGRPGIALAAEGALHKLTPMHEREE